MHPPSSNHANQETQRLASQESAIVVNEKRTRKILAEPNILTKEYINRVYQLKYIKFIYSLTRATLMSPG